MDDRDYQIIDHLIEKPRRSLSSLAKELGISVTAVSNRLKKLEENSIIKFEVSLNLQKFKMTHAFMFIETKDAISRSSVIDRFSKCPLVDKIFSSLKLIRLKFFQHLFDSIFGNALFAEFIPYTPTSIRATLFPQPSFCEF